MPRSRPHDTSEEEEETRITYMAPEKGQEVEAHNKETLQLSIEDDDELEKAREEWYDPSESRAKI